LKAVTSLGMGIMEEETADGILNGSLRIFQKKRGYRFSLDSILLSHFVFSKPKTSNIDLGCGSGIIMLILARRFPHTTWTGVEIQEGLAALAQKNVQLGGLESRIKILCDDARVIKKILPANSFDSVIFNPPYRKLNSGRINPQLEKAIARHEIKGSLKDFLQAAQYLLKPGGRVFTIYPAKRLVELISLFRMCAIEPKRLKLVFSGYFSEAEFVLAEGRSGSREELKIGQPLYIYDQDKKYTREMSAIFSELSRFPADGGG
jgi:tRNA1Val (adenine37-N6)-methyltransferase